MRKLDERLIIACLKDIVNLHIGPDARLRAYHRYDHLLATNTLMFEVELPPDFERPNVIPNINERNPIAESPHLIPPNIADDSQPTDPIAVINGQECWTPEAVDLVFGRMHARATEYRDKRLLEMARCANLPEGCEVVSEAEYANDLVQPGPNRYVLQGRCFGMPIVKRRSFCELEPAKVLKPEEPPDEGTWRTRKGIL